MFKKFFTAHKKLFYLTEGLFTKNTVLVSGLVLAPVVVMGNTLKSAVLLSAAFFIITFFTVTISWFIPAKAPFTLRMISHALIGAVIFIPLGYFLQNMFAEQIYKVSIFLPLLITNSIIVRKSETRFTKRQFPFLMIDLISHIFGFIIVICVIGAVREILGNSSIWGHNFNLAHIPALMFPFSGFIICGFCAAALQKLNNYLSRREEVSDEPV